MRRMAASPGVMAQERYVCRSRGGFTLLELLIAIVLSSLVMVGITRLVKSVLDTFHFQDLKADMLQNAHYSVQRVTEALTECGSCLPVKALEIVDYDASVTKSKFVQKVNPRCAFFITEEPQVDTNTFIVDSVACDAFRYVDTVVVAKVKPDGSMLLLWEDEYVGDTTAVRIDTIVDGTDTIYDTVTVYYILVSSDHSLAKNDMLYGYKTEAWALTQGDSGSLYMYADDPADTSMVLAEDIHTMEITFDYVDPSTNNVVEVVDDWFEMRSGTVLIIARTQRPNPSNNQYLYQQLESRFMLKAVVGQ